VALRRWGAVPQRGAHVGPEADIVDPSHVQVVAEAHAAVHQHLDTCVVKHGRVGPPLEQTLREAGLTPLRT
jgi:hypothetical protein